MNGLCGQENEVHILCITVSNIIHLCMSFTTCTFKCSAMGWAMQKRNTKYPDHLISPKNIPEFANVSTMNSHNFASLLWL